MSRLVYNGLLRIFKPLIFSYLKNKKKQRGRDFDMHHPERFGLYPADRPRIYAPVWIHAVSLGETRACQPLVRLLLDNGFPVLLTHMTDTGRAQGAKLFSEDIAKGSLVQAWIPYDFPDAVNGFFAHWKPRCGVLIEREVWPNLVYTAKQLNIPMVLVSARFSEKSAKFVNSLGGVLKDSYKSLNLILSQSFLDNKHFESIGISSQVTGNLKFDLDIPEDQIELGKETKKQLNRQVVVIASTRDGEEQMFIKDIIQIKKENPVAQNPLYVIIPRHPERFAEVEHLLKKSPLTFARRTDNPQADSLNSIDVLFGDTMGELFFYYGLADYSIVAGSFGDFGGQNHIEACAAGVPVIVGPHTQNFEKSVDDAIIEGVARRAENTYQALTLANTLLSQPDQLSVMARTAKQWLALHQGVSKRIFDYLLPFISDKKRIES
ncbi:3-deoxy-D-manno-octulosonic acid transferase [Taylorella equigenitalis]|uniref:3-deoxy-D-manno-octulosonic acid transferase n=1 Tax=Taylorella equigenitalis TaxID=29575 RepID=UPI0003F913D3|nr:3-deoxy-D-manno-octulosonic acid transferase [Taylorella equigenitalis]ASY29853.1 3-deoxy-D-manno-octulosonic acid transferase [Taylorella equigenitalis]KOS58901.1 3-deoxy-D-manno-octulosonic acid transferase [Taylorella equigenitalis]